MVTNKLLREQLVAEVCDVSTSYLRKGRHEGYGPKFLKIGRSVRYRPEDVETWLASRSRRSTADEGRAE